LLGHPGSLKLTAVTKQDLIEAKSVMARKIREVSERFLARGEPMPVTRKTLGQVEDEAFRRSLEEYFELTGMESIYSIPLMAGEKTPGIMLFESYGEDAFDERALHNMNYLATHTSRALARSHQYTTLPLIKGWEALGRAKNRVYAMPRAKLYILSGLIAAVLLALIFMPWDYNVSGNCVVEPGERRFIYPPFDKIAVKEILVREGNHVTQGQVIARLDDELFQNQLQSLETARSTAEHQMHVAEDGGDIAQAVRLRTVIKGYDLQIVYVRQQIKQCELRSPVQGTVLTRDVEEMEGRVVDTAHGICEIASTKQMKITVQIDEDRISEIYEGQPAMTVITTFAGEEIKGKVSKIPQESTAGLVGKNVFLVEVPLPNEDGKYKPGMMGKTKLHAGQRALGKVIFGDIWDFIKSKLGLD
jgi:multidrug efflux pump subunit AcrA (membrane-fusion protein)